MTDWPVKSGEVKILAELGDSEIPPTPRGKKLILFPRSNRWFQKDKLANTTAIGNVAIFKTTSPGVSDDIKKGFFVGSIWIDETNDDAYVLFDNTVGAAVWQRFATGLGNDTSADIDWDPNKTASPVERQIGNVLCFEMKKSQTKAVIGSDVMPFTINLAQNPTLRVPFTILNTGTAGNVRFKLEATYIAVGEQTDKTPDETIIKSKAIVNTLEEQHEEIFTLDKTKIEVNDFISLNLIREGPDPADTFGGDIGILKRGQIRYKGL